MEPKCVEADHCMTVEVSCAFFVVSSECTEPSRPPVSVWTDPFQIHMQTLVTGSIVLAIAFHNYCLP